MPFTYRNFTLTTSASDLGLMYYADMSFGTSEASNVLIDINSGFNFVPNSSCSNCAEYMSPIYDMETDGSYYYDPVWTNTSEVNLTNKTTEGWVGDIYPAEDLWQLNAATGEDTTYSNIELRMSSTGIDANPPIAVIVLITELLGNFWAPEFFKQNKVSGFLGVGQYPYSDSDPDWVYDVINNFWKALYQQQWHGLEAPGPDWAFLYMIYLRPQASDFSYLTESLQPDLTALPNQPVSSLFTQFESGTMPNMTALYEMETLEIASTSTWAWEISNFEFSFGMVNTTNGTSANETCEWYEDYSGYYNTSLLSMAYPGLGLPTTVFSTFKTQLEFYTSNVFSCDDQSMGGYCSANVSCSEFYPENSQSTSSYSANLTGFSFRVGLVNDNSTYANVPLTSLMRENTTDGDTVCNLYVMNVQNSYPPSSYYILGVPYLQQFVHQFSFGDRYGTSNKFNMTTSPNAYVGSAITNVTYQQQWTSPFEAWPSAPVTPDSNDSTSGHGVKLGIIIFVVIVVLILIIALIYVAYHCFFKDSKKNVNQLVYSGNGALDNTEEGAGAQSDSLLNGDNDDA